MSERTPEEKKRIAKQRFDRYRITASRYYKQLARSRFVAGELQNNAGNFSPQRYGRAVNRTGAIRQNLIQLIRKFETERQEQGLPRVRQRQIDELFEAFLQRQPENLGEGLIFTAAIAPPTEGEGKKREEKKKTEAGGGQLTEEQIKDLGAKLKAQYIDSGQPEGVAEAAASMLMRQLRGDPTATGTIILPRVAGTEAPAPERQQMTEEPREVGEEPERQQPPTIPPAPERIEIGVPPTLDVIPEVDNAQRITRDAATGSAGFVVDQNDIRRLQRIARERGLDMKIVRQAPEVLRENPDWGRLVEAVGAVGIGELVSAFGFSVPPRVASAMAQAAISGIRAAGEAAVNAFNERFTTDEDGRIRPRQLDESDVDALRQDMEEELSMLVTNGTITEDTRDAFNTILEKDVAGVQRTNETKEREYAAFQNLFDYIGGDQIDSDSDETRNRRVRELIGVIDLNLPANETKVREVKENVDVLDIKDRLRPETLFDAGAAEYVRETNAVLDAEYKKIDENEELTEDRKYEMKAALARQAQVQIANVITPENYQGFVPHIGADLRFQAEESPISRFVNAAVRAPGMQPVIRALQQLPQYQNLASYAGVGGVAGAYASSGILTDFLYNAARGAGLGLTAGVTVDQLVRAVNPELQRRYGVQIPPAVLAGLAAGAAGLGSVAGGAGAELAGQALGLISEEPVVPPTLEVVQQDDATRAQQKGRSAGIGTLRPKFIVPGVGVLEPSAEEVQADFSEFAAFDFVQPTSEGTEGTAATNVLKRQNLTEEAIRYQGAGVEVHQAYGMFPPYTDTQEEKMFVGPELPEMEFVDQRFDLSEYELQSYDPNGDRTAIEMLSPYLGGTNTSQNWMTMPTSILYSVVP